MLTFKKDTIDRYVKSLKEKSVTPNEIKRKLKSVSKFLNWTVTTGRLDQNDFKQMEGEIAKSVNSFISDKSPVIPTERSEWRDPSTTLGMTNFNIQNYIAFAVVLLLISLIGFGLYNQFFKKASTPFAYSTTLNPGSRIISFQGRLTDSLGNPIIAPIDLTYKFYTVSSGGSAITASTRVCTATPDQDGIFANLIGSDPGPSCTPELPATIFSENPNVWLGVTVGSELTEMSPRQQIANVGYAMNAETLQGFPPGTTTSSIPFISTQGDLLIAAATPGIRSTYTTANFVISSAKTTTIQSANAGDIVLSATDGGALRFNTFNGSLVERITVLSGGNVGISNVNPLAALDVIGSASLSANLSFSGASTQISQLNGGNISFATSVGGDAGATTKLTLTNLGNLGIGSTSPSQKLDITGNATLSGTLALGPQIPGYAGTCDATAAGKMYYDGIQNNYYFCNGTTWTQMGSGGVQYWSRGTGVLFPTTTTDGVAATTSATTVATFTATGSNDAARIGGSTNYATINANGNLTFTNAGIATITGPTTGLTIDATTGALNFGTSANARTITIGNATTTTGLALDSGTGDIVLTSTDQIKLNSTKTAGGTTTEALSLKSTIDLGVADELLQIGDSGADFLTVLGNGNVGIGTALPLEKLDIAGNATMSGNLTIGQTGVLRSQYGPLNLAYKSALDTWATGLTLQDTTGNVGIGSSNPTTFKLEVAGNIGPEADNTRNIGGVGKAYNTIYVNNIIGAGSLGYWSRGTGVLFPTTATDGVAATTSATTVATFTSTGSNDAARIGGVSNYLTVGSTGSLTFNAVTNDIVTGSNEHLALMPNGTGNVGISNTSPLEKLDVTGGASLSANLTIGQTGVLRSQYGPLNLAYKSGLGTWATGITLQDTTGFVGIGSSNPVNALDVNGVVNVATGYRIANAATSGNFLRGDGTNFVSSAILSGDIPSGSAYYIQNQTAGDQAADFRINGNGLFNGGNVGIGSLTPAEKLDIVGNASMSGNLTIGQTGVLRSQYGPLNLAYKSGLNTWATGFTLQDTTGNVGIGTTGPAYKLDVNGTTNTSGLLANINYNSSSSVVGTFANGRNGTVGNTFFVGKINTNLFQTDSELPTVSSCGTTTGIGVCGYGGTWSENITNSTTLPTGSSGNTHSVNHSVSGGDFRPIVYDNPAENLSSRTFTFSLWVKTEAALDGQTSTWSSAYPGDLNGQVEKTITLSTSWQRVFFTRTLPAGGIAGDEVRTYFTIPVHATARVYFWGMQIEESSLLSPYEKTNGTLWANDTIGMWASDFRLGGTPAVPNTYWDNTNNRLGIGSTTPTAKLDIAGDASTSGILTFRGATDPKIRLLNGESLTFQTSPGGDTGLLDRMTILNTGNVGIGTTSPGSKLHVLGNIQLGKFDTAAGSKYIGLASNSDTWGVDGMSGMEIESVTGAGNYDQNLHFWTHDYGAGTGSRKLTIKYDGNVGIGTTGPGAKLGFAAATTAAGGIDFGGDVNLYRSGANILSTDDGIYAGGVFRSTVTGGQSAVELYDGATQIASLYDLSGAGTIGGLELYSAGVKTIMLRADANNSYINAGNVGIGTTSPAALLDVRGNATFSGTLSIAPMFIAAAGTCNISSTGKIYYDATLNQYYFCNGTIWTGMGGGASSLQGAYDGGNTIATTNARDIAFTLTAGLATPTSLTLTNNHVSAVSDFILTNANASGTNTNGILVNQTGAGTLTNGINITQTAGTISSGLTFTGITNDITTGTNQHLALMPNGTGNVGVGTSSPVQKLDVTGNTQTQTLKINSGAGQIFTLGKSGTNEVMFANDNTTDAYLEVGSAISSTRTYNGNLIIWGSEAGAWTNRLTLGQSAGTYGSIQATGNLALQPTSGNVGIGTTGPLQKLHIVGASILSDSTALDPDTYPSTVVAGGIADGSGWGATGIGGNAGTGDSWALAHNGSALYLGMQNGVAANTMQTYMQFEPNRNMYLVPTSGNVGIGTTSPGFKLDVVGGVTVQGGDWFRNFNVGTVESGNYEELRIGPSGNIFYLQMLAGGTGVARPIDFNMLGGSALRIDTTGYVGIGSTNPGTLLDVNGTARAKIFQVNDNASGGISLYSGGSPINHGIAFRSTASAGTYGDVTAADWSDYFFSEDGLNRGWIWRYNNTTNVASISNRGYLDIAGNLTVNGTGNSSIAGNVGIGSTAPTAKLDIAGNLNVQGYATASASLSIGSYNSMGGVGNGLFSGNVGIGTTNATSRFFVNLGANQLARFNDGTNASGLNLQNGSILSQSSQFQIAATSTNPLSFYTGATTNSMTPGTERMRLSTGGNLGIGGALNTNAQLDLNGGTILAGQYCPTSTCQRYIVPNGTSRIDQLQVASDLPNNTGYISFLDANNSYVPIASISAQATGTVVIDNTATSITDVGYPTVPDLCIGDPFWCTGKVDAGTIDPPYTINGKRYATFLTAMTGVKEETTGTVATNFQFEIRNLKSNSNDLISKGYAVKVIDFNDLPEASDLWLFSKTTNLRKNLGKMTVLLTPSDDTRTWYKVDNATHSLTIYSSRPTTISYRLTAPRFDGERWRNENPGGSGGFELNDPDQPSLVTLNQVGNVPAETFTISPVIANDASVIPSSPFVIPSEVEGSLHALTLGRDDIVKAYRVISNKTGDFIEEVGVFAQITVGQIKAGFIETENAIVNNILLAKNIIVQEKIISPVVETKEIKTQGGDLIVSLRGTSETSDAAISSNEIASSPTTSRNDNGGALAKLIIKGLNNQTVASIDANGNATFAGTLTANDVYTEGLTARSATISGSLTASEASLSGTLVAKEVRADNITALEDRLNAIASASMSLRGTSETSDAAISGNGIVYNDNALFEQINIIQAELAQIKNAPLPNAAYYQNLSSSVIASGSEAISGGIVYNDIFDTLTVTGNSNLYNASVANSLTAGNIFIQNNEILSLSWELKLSALAQITLFDGSVTIAKNGNITTKGELIAEGGIKTDTIQPTENGKDVTFKLPSVIPSVAEGSLHSGRDDNSKLRIIDPSNNEVASIDASGFAKFNALGFNQIATNSAIIADSGLRTAENEIIPAMQTNESAAGMGTLPTNTPEIIIYNSKVTKDSLIYLTKTGETGGNPLTVVKKEIGDRPYFSVSAGNSQHPEIRFNWLIIN